MTRGRNRSGIDIAELTAGTLSQPSEGSLARASIARTA